METKHESKEKERPEIEVPVELSADFESASDDQAVRIEEFPDGVYRLVHIYGANERRSPAEIGSAETNTDDEPDDFDEEPLRPLKTALVYHLTKGELLERYRLGDDIES